MFQESTTKVLICVFKIDESSVRSEEESFRCPICLERLNIPRCLPCLHTFCETCIQTYISSKKTSDKEGDFNVVDCPVCRQWVQEPEKDISSEDWAKSLPLNKWAWTMTINHENESVKYCLFCKREELTVLAKHWCKSCAEPICDDCKRFHKRAPSLKDHDIVDMQDTVKWNKAIDIDENCTIHKGKVIELFCQDHKRLCCSVCFANQHRRCANFDSIDEIVKKLSKDEMRDKLESLSSLLQCITKLQKENKSQYDGLCTKKEDICSLFAKKIEEAKVFLDQAHEQWLKRFEVEHKHHTDNIEVVSDELKRFHTTTTEVKSMLSSVLDSGSDRQIFVVQSKLHAQITDHFNHLETLKIWELTYSYSFKSNQLEKFTKTIKFEDAIPSKKLSDALNKILVCGKSITGKDLPSPLPWLANIKLMSATFKKVSDCYEKECVGYYGLFIDDNRVVISNFSEKSLDVYDTTNYTAKPVYSFKCDSEPYDMCYAFGMDRVYVAFGKCVVQYEIKNEGTTFVEVERIPVKGNVIGIAKTVDGFVTANKSSTTFRWSDFSIKCSLQNGKLRDWPVICSSFCGRKIAYNTEGGVIVMDTKGNKLSEYSCSGRKQVGLSFDAEGNVITCFCDSQPEQINCDGKSRRFIKFEGTYESFIPGNITFHPEGHRCIVFKYCNRGCTIFRIFEIAKL